MDVETEKELLSQISLLVAAVAMHFETRRSLIRAILANRIFREPVTKVPVFYEVVVPQMNCVNFRSFFRMDAETFASLVEFLRPGRLFEMRHKISVDKKIAFACSYLGSKATTLRLSQLFSVSEETFIRGCEDVLDAIIDKVDQLIYFPSEEEFPFIAAEFDKVGRRLKKCLGAVDSIHLEISVGEDEKWCSDAFRNYKQWYSIHLQGVATYDMRWLHVHAGWPGRAHDGRVYRHSGLPRILRSALNDRRVPTSDTYHILGDKAYPLSQELLTPYTKPRTRQLTADEKLFNRHLSSKRQNVERAFSLLLRRFPRLIKLNQKTLEKKIKVVLAACALHNLCILEADNVDYFLRVVTRNRVPPRGILLHRRSEEERVAVGIRKREQLLADILRNR